MRNRIITSILFTAIIALGCNKSNSIELTEIETQLEKLKKENLMLKDSIAKINIQDLDHRMLIGIPDGKMRVGKKNRIVFLLHSFKELPKYDIYKIEGNKEIKIGSSNISDFDYEFNPKSINDNRLKLKVKIPLKNKIIEIPSEMIIPIE